MTSPQSATLLFFYSPTGVETSFVIPVFDAGGLYIQCCDGTGRIQSFQEWNLSTILEYDKREEFEGVVNTIRHLNREKRFFIIVAPCSVRNSIIPKSLWPIVCIPLDDQGNEDQLYTCKIGQKARYAYNATTKVFYGGREKMIGQLRKCREAGFWQEKPFSEIEVAEFVGDDLQYRQAVTKATMVIRDSDPNIASKWESFMLLSQETEQIQRKRDERNIGQEL
jgi:hypothetical protein